MENFNRRQATDARRFEALKASMSADLREPTERRRILNFSVFRLTRKFRLMTLSSSAQGETTLTIVSDVPSQASPNALAHPVRRYITLSASGIHENDNEYTCRRCVMRGYIGRLRAGSHTCNS